MQQLMSSKDRPLVDILHFLPMATEGQGQVDMAMTVLAFCRMAARQSIRDGNMEGTPPEELPNAHRAFSLPTPHEALHLRINPPTDEVDNPGKHVPDWRKTEEAIRIRLINEGGLEVPLITETVDLPKVDFRQLDITTVDGILGLANAYREVQGKGIKQWEDKLAIPKYDTRFVLHNQVPEQQWSTFLPAERGSRLFNDPSGRRSGQNLMSELDKQMLRGYTDMTVEEVKEGRWIDDRNKAAILKDLLAIRQRLTLRMDRRVAREKLTRARGAMKSGKIQQPAPQAHRPSRAKTTRTNTDIQRPQTPASG